MKIARIACSLFLLVASLLAVWSLSPVLAQEEESQESQVLLEATYPKVESTSGTDFHFLVDITYSTTTHDPLVFDLGVISPPGWTSYITAQYESTRFSAIKIMSNNYPPQRIQITVTTPAFPVPAPGEYEIILDVSSGNISSSIKLTAVVTATYSLELTPTTQRYNTSATSGKDTIYSIVVENTGSANLGGIKFSSSKPDGWAVDFTPVQIDSLAAASFQTVDVNIKPGPKTIAGDYQISLFATSPEASKQIDVRVTVETPTIWGWLGVIIIVVVIAGVAYAFMRFSRR